MREPKKALPCPDCGKLTKSVKAHKRFCSPTVQNASAKLQQPYSEVDRICDMAEASVGGTDVASMDKFRFVDKMRRELCIRDHVNMVPRYQLEEIQDELKKANRKLVIISNAVEL